MSANGPEERINAMYCRRCWYPLWGLTGTNCPECGRAFDPARPQTYHRRPRGRTVLRRVLLCLLVLPTLLVAYVGWYAWRAHLELRSIHLAHQRGIKLTLVKPHWWAPVVVTEIAPKDQRPLFHSGLSRYADPPPSSPITDADAAIFSGSSNIVSISSGQKLTDAGLKHLSKLRKLEELHLGGSSISDEGVMALSTLQNLVQLDLSRTSVGDKAMEAVGKMKKLYVLSLVGTKITDKGLSSLVELQELAVLDLSQTRISGEGLKHLPKMTNLCILTLNDLSLWRADLRPLTKIPKLEVLEMERTLSRQQANILRDQAQPGLVIIPEYPEEPPVTKQGSLVTPPPGSLLDQVDRATRNIH